MVPGCRGGWTQRTWYQVVVEAGHRGHGIRLCWCMNIPVSRCVVGDSPVSVEVIPPVSSVTKTK